jgi:altronate dehydratase small subunit
VTANWNALALDPRDGVALALRDLAAGETVAIRAGAAIETLVAREAVALGHKIARRDHPAGAPVLKYGERIGLTTAAIAAGAHVHVHNLASARARKEGS